MMGDTNVPVQAIRRQICAAIHLVVQIKRMNDGSRKITNISEVVPELDDHGRYIIRDIFRFIQRGRAQDGKIIGEMIATGQLPSFMDEIEINRLPFPKENFTPPQWYVEMMNKESKAA
jgi:pilus assembly protein CpaF